MKACDMPYWPRENCGKCIQTAAIYLYFSGQIDSNYTIVFAMIGKAGISGGWAALQVFSAELFPTVIRYVRYTTHNGHTLPSRDALDY